MIEKKRRISRTLFPHSNTKKSLFHGDTIMMVYYPINQAKYSSFGIIASKKIFKNSVKRNYFKRVLFEIVKKNEERFDVKFKGLIIFSSKKGGFNATYSQLQEEIQRFLV